MTYKVFLRHSARQFLIALEAEDRPRARELALVLQSLRKNPEPPGSRELTPSRTEPVPGGRVWVRPDWVVTYVVDERSKTVDIGRIERRS